MKHYAARGFDAFRPAAEGMVAALAEAKGISEVDRIFVERIIRLGFHSAGYIRLFGQGQFHSAGFLFGGTVPNWAERYQTQHYRIDDPVVLAACRTTGAFTLDEVAGPSPLGALILKDSRRYGLYDGFCAPIRAEYDEMGLVMLGTDRLLDLGDYERFLLRGMCEAYAQAGLKMLLAPHAAPPSLTRRETECLRWVAIGRSDPQIGMILGLSPNTVHAHVEAAKCKLGANSRAQLVLRAVMAGILSSDPSQQWSPTGARSSENSPGEGVPVRSPGPKDDGFKPRPSALSFSDYHHVPSDFRKPIPHARSSKGGRSDG